jgi:hypothetical protein
MEFLKNADSKVVDLRFEKHRRVGKGKGENINSILKQDISTDNNKKSTD